MTNSLKKRTQRQDDKLQRYHSLDPLRILITVTKHHITVVLQTEWRRHTQLPQNLNFIPKHIYRRVQHEPLGSWNSEKRKTVPSHKKLVTLCSLTNLLVQLSLKLFGVSHKIIAIKRLGKTATHQIRHASIGTLPQPVAQLAHVFYHITMTHKIIFTNSNPKKNPAHVLPGAFHWRTNATTAVSRARLFRSWTIKLFPPNSISEEMLLIKSLHVPLRVVTIFPSRYSGQRILLPLKIPPRLTSIILAKHDF